MNIVFEFDLHICGTRELLGYNNNYIWTEILKMQFHSLLDNSVMPYMPKYTFNLKSALELQDLYSIIQKNWNKWKKSENLTFKSNANNRN